MSASQETLIAFVLDRSGSMTSIKQSTLEAFNAYLDGLKVDPEGIKFSLILFDTEGIDTLYKNVPVIEVENLTGRTYVPRAGTPLIDAAFKTIRAVEKKVAEHAVAPKVVVCIQTDGEENSSREHTWEALSALIREKTEAGWQFNFMGAGIDAYQQGARMGISAAQTMSYESVSPEMTRKAFFASASNARNFARGASAHTGYSREQRLAAGDRWAPKLGAAVVVAPPKVSHEVDL